MPKIVKLSFVLFFQTRDVSLTAILNHIAYVNRAALSAEAATQEDLEKVRKSKVEWVLNVTYITAMWGLMLCLSNMGRPYSPFGNVFYY